MPHKAGKDFFKVKKEWSKRKDLILEDYFPRYLPKVASLGKPIFLVDGFAGKGLFDDGLPGSPLIMCKHAQIARGNGIDVKVLCTETDPELFESLKRTLLPYEFAEARHGKFLELVPHVSALADSHTIFLYLDPYTPDGVEWDALDQIFSRRKTAGSSIEVLWNFNAQIFVRGGLAALKRKIPPPDPCIEDVEELDIEFKIPPSVEKLNGAVGGPWWIDAIQSKNSFVEQVHHIAEGVIQRLAKTFPEVCSVAIKKEERHRIPYYYMVFGSRHPAALEIMNDAMWKARHDGIFTMDLLADVEIPSLVLKLAEEPLPRGKLIISVMRKQFSRLKRIEIRQYIEDLLKDGQMDSSTGKWRINDDVLVWRNKS